MADAKVADPTRTDTYRYVRAGMPVMILMLAMAVVVQRINSSDFQTSISAYYFTAAHSSFIGVLCAIGALLIVFRGSTDTEDILLDLAGVMAFFVALVPTGRPKPIYGPGLPEDYTVDAGINNNVWAALVALAAASVLSYVLAKLKHEPTEISKYGKWARAIKWIVTGVFVATFLFARPRFVHCAHYTAAVTLFVAITAVVFINAYLAGKQCEQLAPNKDRYRSVYRKIGWAMVATLPVVFGVHHFSGGWPQAVLALETLLLLEFASFWAIQTVELWDAPSRLPLISDDMRPTLAPL